MEKRFKEDSIISEINFQITENGKMVHLDWLSVVFFFKLSD